MPSYKYPGVYVEETISQATIITGANLSAAAFLAPNPRGPVTPAYITSWSQYLTMFGGWATGYYLPHAVYQYFANGGREAWVARTAGSGAVAATKTLNDRAGTPLPTLKVDALNPGVWGNSIYVDISDSGTDRFNLIVRFGGTGDQYIVERWTDLSMLDTDARFAPNIVNSQAGGSVYIKVTDLVSATSGAAWLDRPAIQTATVLAAGTDGAAAAESDITTALGTVGTSIFDVIDAPLTFNLPGDGVAGTHTALLNYCATRGDCFAVLDPPSGQSAAAAASFATSITPISSFGALYYPWIHVADPAGGTGATRLVPPGGAVLGQYAATDVQRGVFKTPAGLSNRISGAFAIETKLSNTDLGNLHAANVNVVRQIPGAGVVVMGGRTLKPNGADKYISVRRSLIYIRSSLVTSTRFAIFEPNDQVLWHTLQTVIERFLLDFWQSGGLRGASPGEAYYVKCNSENNPGSAIAAGAVNIEIGVALQYPAEFIVMKLSQREAGAAVTIAA